MVLRRTKDLNLGLAQEQYQHLAARFIRDANDISGDIVLRAAKRGKNANELMGIVLSRYLIKRELGKERYFGWYFLDDYADWLGQREEQIADILALSPEQVDGVLRLAIVVTEAKYIDVASLASKRRESQKQLRDTMRRVREALFGSPERLDRDLWLARISDLILDGVQIPASATINLSDWRRAIREGNCDISLMGYSHVFVSGPTDSPECSERVAVADCENSYQEIFSRSKLRELVLYYWNESDPVALRLDVGGESTEIDRTYSKPTQRVAQSSVGSAADSSSTAQKLLDEAKLPETFSNQASISSTPLPIIPEQSMQTQPAVSSWAWNRLPDALINQMPKLQDTNSEESWLNEAAIATKAALQLFQLNSRLIEKKLTPNAAILKFQGSANLTVEQVIRRRSEFLTTHKLNVISVRAEPGVVALSIARPVRRVLTLPELWSRWNPDCSRGNQQLLIGEREENGSLLYLSPLDNAPHTLIAGSTGSGKSVLMQNIILSIAATNRPEQAQILLIDPKKGVDYAAFKGLPHLQTEVIKAADESLTVLNQLVVEMNRRYDILETNGVSKVTDLYVKPDASETPPIIWVIHDEFAV